MLMCADVSTLAAVMLLHGVFTNVVYVRLCLEVPTPTRQACVPGMLNVARYLVRRPCHTPALCRKKVPVTHGFPTLNQKQQR